LPRRAIGFYSKGQLQKAQSVFEHGTAIHKLFVARKRLYTTDEMHKVLTDASDFLHSTFPEAEVLQVGDLSLKDGGLAEGHASHQNGLDADIVYLRNNGYVQPAESKSWEEDFCFKSVSFEKFQLREKFFSF
jgi:penicillin-insensitive murein endopeptidase